MKRSGLLFFFFITTHILCAQIQLGVKAGLNLSDVVINDYYDPNVEPAFKVKSGLHAGFFVSTQVDEKFGFAAELLYSSKGVRTFSVINLHYVAVPLLLRYHFHPKWFLEVGPEIGYLVSAHSKYGNANATWDNKLDIGLDGGIQYNPGKIFCGFRFNAGFSNLIQNAGTNPNESERYQNRVAQFFVAVPLKEIMH